MSEKEAKCKNVTEPECSPVTKTCSHWVTRKKRFCKMTVGKNKEYCGEHEPTAELPQGEIAAEGERIFCPLDSKHTIYKKNLRKHLKICNARPKIEVPAYLIKNFNAGEIFHQTHPDLRLTDLSNEDFYGIIKKVRDIYTQYIENQIPFLTLYHESLEKELNKREYGQESRKHLSQASALLGILNAEQYLDNSMCFVEFGAGKGQLAYYLAKLLENKQNSQVILIDRMSLRHKKDNKIQDRSLITRIRCDIADLCIEKLPFIQSDQCCVAVSKHLCGAATDLTLRCVSQTKQKHVDFILIAVCCHHRCDWSSFVGKEFFQEHHLTSKDFLIITKMASWAICGTGMSRERRQALEKQDQPSQDDSVTNIKQRLCLAERETIGFMCKRLLDYARLKFLQLHGYEVALKYYIPKNITLENVILLAKRKKNI
uniref:tRNA:m(4)X modification enzyme TRM13 n=1 Tax=Glossina brevipalpis TaxID=37001 RepID=A0A1A9W5N8_9MUSC